jgi:hypothetical protein
MTFTDVLKLGDLVRHNKYGNGKVELDKGVTVLVRFEHGIEECEKTSLQVLLTPLQTLRLKEWHAPLEVIVRVQAETIQSVNDAWGVFSPSNSTATSPALGLPSSLGDMADAVASR